MFARSGGKWQPSMIFKAGEYPDKGITITAADIARLASTSSTIPISIGHPSVDSPIDGMMGVVTDIEARGEELWGTPKPAKWLDELLPDEVGISVWLTWSPQRLVDASIVSSPRVDGASLRRAIEYAFSAGKGCPRKEPAMEGTTTNPWEKFSQFLMGQLQGGRPLEAAPPAPAPPPNPQPVPDPQFAAMQAELASYRQAASEARKSEITVFSQALIEKGRIQPSQKAEVDSLLLAAAEADQSNVQFSAKPEGGFYAQLKKLLEALPEDPKGLLRSGFSVIPAQTKSEEEDVASAFAKVRGESK
jgi:hypothetical protein